MTGLFGIAPCWLNCEIPQLPSRTVVEFTVYATLAEGTITAGHLRKVSLKPGMDPGVGFAVASCPVYLPNSRRLLRRLVVDAHERLLHNACVGRRDSLEVVRQPPAFGSG